MHLVSYSAEGALLPPVAVEHSLPSQCEGLNSRVTSDPYRIVPSWTHADKAALIQEVTFFLSCRNIHVDVGTAQCGQVVVGFVRPCTQGKQQVAVR